MDKKTASQLIKEIAESIKNDPAQFHFNVNVSGMNVVSNGHSTGMIVSATGGAPFSNTTGLNVSLNSPQIEIAKEKANALLTQQMTVLYNTLIEISKNILEEKNTSIIDKLYKQLLNTWVPSVITSIIGNIISLSCGIAF